MTTAKQVLEEEYTRSMARDRLLHDARERMKRSDHDGALFDVIHVISMLSDSEKRVMQVHAECVAMLEHASKILSLDASLRPVIIQIPSDSPSNGDKT